MGVFLDLLITDIQMPEMNGYELVAAVRIDHPDIPILVMTGLDDPERERLDPHGPIAVEKKPPKVQSLQTVIEYLILQKQMMSQKNSN